VTPAGTTEIGKYRLLAPIGEGGMGEVYLAEHTLMGKRVAVKLMRPAVAESPELVERFLNEARATARVSHPGIVQVFDCGTSDEGRPYLAMELLSGCALSRFLEQHGALGHHPSLVRRLAISTARAVHAAHAAGIIHRDLKPDNLFLCAHHDGPDSVEVKVLDFGIAKLAPVVSGLNARATRSGAMMGTAAYMAPEQCRASKTIDGRADIYSLGCIIFELVTGRPPFVAQALGEWIAAHLMDEPPRLRSVAPDADRELDDLVWAMLAKDPGARPADMSRVADLLARGLGGNVPTGPIVLPPGLTLGTGDGAAGDGRPGGAAPGSSPSPYSRTTPLPRTTPTPPVATPVPPPATPPPRATPLPAVRAGGTLPLAGPVPTKRSPRWPPETTLSAGAAEAQLRRGGGGARLLAGGAAALIAIGAAAYFVVRGRAGFSDGGEAAAPPPAAIAPAAGTGRSGDEAAPEPAADPRPRLAPATVTIAVSGAPLGARATLDGAPVGLPLRLPRGRTRHALRIEAPGYEPFEEEVSAAADGTVEMTARRLPPTPAAAAGGAERAAGTAPPPRARARDARRAGPAADDASKAGKRRAKDLLLDI
jgi:eukaryotic-like serine/threonine-protein kinase